MKEKHRIHYESPYMDCIPVQAESDFMSGSIMEHPDSKAEIKGHEVGNEYDFETKTPQSGFDVSWE